MKRTLWWHVTSLMRHLSQIRNELWEQRNSSPAGNMITFFDYNDRGLCSEDLGIHLTATSDHAQATQTL